MVGFNPFFWRIVPPSMDVDVKMGFINRRMGTTVSTQVNEIWLLGASIIQVWTEQLFPSTAYKNTADGVLFGDVFNWKAFQKIAQAEPEISRKRTLLFCDGGALTHRDIIQMQHMRKSNPHFAPVIYFDSLDLGKLIHTFDSDLAGYCTYTDSVDELHRLIRTVKAGKLYYSAGFCNELSEFGFPIQTH